MAGPKCGGSGGRVKRKRAVLAVAIVKLMGARRCRYRGKSCLAAGRAA